MSLFRCSCLLFLFCALTLYACGISGTPSAPQNVTATSGEGQVTITWDPVSDATSYNLYMASEPGVTVSTYSLLADGTAHRDVLSPFALTGLTNGLTYYVVLTAENEHGESSESAEVSAVPFGTWVYEQVGSAVTYFKQIFFIDNSTGWVVGAIQDPPYTTTPTPVVYKTEDGGNTWMQVFQDAEYGYAYGLHFVDSNNGWMSIAGMSSPHRIYATADGGSTWNVKYNPSFPVYDISAIDVNNAWAVGFSSSALHTTDGFQTCESLYIGDILYQAWNIEMVSPSTGYIASVDDKKVFKTVDGGTTWSHVHTGIKSFNALDFVDENTGWVGGNFLDLWHTQDGGATWTQLNVPSSFDTIRGISFIDNLHGWLTTAYFSADGGEIWRTGDGGQTWTLVYTDYTTTFNKIQVNDFTHGWVSTRTGGVVRLK